MPRKFSTFQMIVFGLTIIAIIIAVIMFALNRGGGQEKLASITMWGLIDQDVFNQLVADMQVLDIDLTNVTYIKKDERTVEAEYVEALAEGNAPDIIMFTQDQIVQNTPRILMIPYDSYSARTFKDTFIQEGELFLGRDGIIAMPFIIDPMVMYWNRTHFQNTGISRPPQYWDEVMSIVPILTERDSSFNVLESAVSMGEFRNVLHAKEILISLILQAGNPVVKRKFNEENEREGYEILLSERLGFTVPPAQAALNFFTQFANPSKEVYSWNRSLPDSDNRFVAGDLSMYFGFASEFNNLRQRNPNLNFDVSIFPQSRNSEERKTFGKMYVLAISRTTEKVPSAFGVIMRLTDPLTIGKLSEKTGLPPVRRDLLNANTEDQNSIIFFNSALWSQAILDPDKNLSNGVFQNMVESYTTGRTGLQDSVDRANQELVDLLKLI